MKKIILNYLSINNRATIYITIVAFVLIPLLVMLRLFYPAPTLEYGHGEASLNSVFLLLFSIYAFFVVVINFIQCHNFWKTGSMQWKTQLNFAYILVFIFALSIPFLMMFQAASHYDAVDHHRFTITGSAAFRPQDFMGCLIYCGPAFLFPTGIALFFLGLSGFQYLTGGNKSSLTTIFVASGLFTLCGAPFAWIMFGWWIGGGINPW